MTIKIIPIPNSNNLILGKDIYANFLLIAEALNDLEGVSLYELDTTLTYDTVDKFKLLGSNSYIATKVNPKTLFGIDIDKDVDSLFIIKKNTADEKYIIGQVFIQDGDTYSSFEVTLVETSSTLNWITTANGDDLAKLIEANTKGVAENKADIATNATVIATNKTAIATNSDDIGKNVKDITDNATEIAANKTAIETNSKNIMSNVSAIQDNEDDITINKTGVAKNVTDITENKTNITANTTDVLTNKEDIAKNVTAIAANYSDIGKNVKDITDNSTEIATNKTAIAKNVTDITANKTSIDSLGDKLTTKEIEITDLKNIPTLGTDENGKIIIGTGGGTGTVTPESLIHDFDSTQFQVVKGDPDLLDKGGTTSLTLDKDFKQGSTIEFFIESSETPKETVNYQASGTDYTIPYILSDPIKSITITIDTTATILTPEATVTIKPTDAETFNWSGWKSDYTAEDILTPLKKGNSFTIKTKGVVIKLTAPAPTAKTEITSPALSTSELKSDNETILFRNNIEIAGNTILSDVKSASLATDSDGKIIKATAPDIKKYEIDTFKVTGILSPDDKETYIFDHSVTTIPENMYISFNVWGTIYAESSDVNYNVSVNPHYNTDENISSSIVQYVYNSDKYDLFALSFRNSSESKLLLNWDKDLSSSSDSNTEFDSKTALTLVVRYLKEV